MPLRLGIASREITIRKLAFAGIGGLATLSLLASSNAGEPSLIAIKELKASTTSKVSRSHEARDESLKTTRDSFPRRCRRNMHVSGHFDADRSKDLAFNDWRQRGPVVGVCLASGKEDRIRGEGQNELLAVADIMSDGRDEIIFGATTMRAQIYHVGMVRKGALRRVLFKDEHLVLVEGLDEGYVTRRRPAGGAFECKKSNQEPLVQAIVFPRRSDNSFRWKRLSYRLEARRAVITDRDRGTFPDDPNKKNTTEVVQLSQELVGDCELRE